jgi:cbb3-type cytochrome oxidase subunit 1
MTDHTGHEQHDPRRGDEVALAHLLVAAPFFAFGAVLVLLTQVGAVFGDLLAGAVSYGRLRPAAWAAVMLGGLVPGFVGAAYYLLPRLTGVGLWGVRIAYLGLFGTVGSTLVGMVWVMAGRGDGVEPFGFPLWLDVLVLAALLVPSLVTVQTVRARTLRSGYVALWYLVAGVLWLPLLYLVGNLPGLASLGRELGAAHFTAGFSTLWVATMGVGVALYVVAKAGDRPLSGRVLAQAGFWSLAFAGSWAGVAQLSLGPTPDWVDPVAAVFGLAFPVAALAIAGVLASTTERSWAEVSDDPPVLAALTGGGLLVVASLAWAAAGFRAPAALVGLTEYWDGVVYLVVLGVGGLLLGSGLYLMVPALTGRRLESASTAVYQIRLVALGTGATALLLMAAGMVRGFAWTGGSYTGAFSDVGEGWMFSAGQADLLSGLAILTGLLATVGQALLVLTVFRTITSGRADVAEVLVEEGVG